jgi:hypothetical protein
MDLAEIEKISELVEAAINQTDMVEKNRLLEFALKALHQLRDEKKEKFLKIYEEDDILE